MDLYMRFPNAINSWWTYLKAMIRVYRLLPRLGLIYALHSYKLVRSGGVPWQRAALCAFISAIAVRIQRVGPAEIKLTFKTPQELMWITQKPQARCVHRYVRRMVVNLRSSIFRKSSGG